MLNRLTAHLSLLLLIPLLSFGAEATPLRIGVVEGAKFGNHFDGVREHPESASFTFTRQPTDLALSYVAYDIDSGAEVAIEVNGQFLAQVVSTGDKQTRSWTVAIGADRMVDGENTIVFRQRVPGYVWGVTELLLEVSDEPFPKATPLRVGVVEGAKFGNHFDGVREYPESAAFTFTRQPTDLALAYAAYDIDSGSEVAIEVNGQVLAQAVSTADKETRGGTVRIGTDRMVDGENTIVFRQRVPGYVWGVTDLLLEVADSLQADAGSLTIDVTDDARYGFGYDGRNDHREGVRFEFQGGSGDDLVLYYSAYDTDDPDEVAVELNGTVIGHLTRTDDEATRDDFIVLPASTLLPGTNTLLLRQRVPGYRWGVTSLLLVEYWCP